MGGEGSDSYVSSMKSVVTFKYFGDEAIRDLLSKSEVLRFAEGDTIIREGEKSPYFFAVLEGTVNVTVHDGAKEVFISTIGRGDVFGEAGIFLSVKRTANVASASASTLFRIHRDSLLRFIKERPSEGVKFLMIIIYSLLKKLRDANQELAFERKSDFQQDDIDSMVRSIMGEG